MPDPSDVRLIDQFIAAAVSAAATVEVILPDAELLNAALMKAVAGHDCIIFAEPDDLDPALFSIFRQDPRVITQPSTEQLKTATVGVTDAFCAVASTGSVCVTMSDHLTSHASMLTRKHIVVVDGTTIVARPRDVFSETMGLKNGLSRSFSFITGPSATADMGPLVRGVHGPGAIHIIVLTQPDIVNGQKTPEADDARN
jgi:L-lactate dehydrogenase complex protein LldG